MKIVKKNTIELQKISCYDYFIIIYFVIEEFNDFQYCFYIIILLMTYLILTV